MLQKNQTFFCILEKGCEPRNWSDYQKLEKLVSRASRKKTICQHLHLGFDLQNFKKMNLNFFNPWIVIAL